MSLIRTFVRSCMKIEPDGIANLPKEGPVIIAANHVTNFDVWPMQVVTPRPIFFMAKVQLYNPYTDWWLRRMGAFPVRRGEQDSWAVEHARVILLQEGQTLGMFPEGTRSKGNGLRPGKTGAARLALETRSTIVPMALMGTNQVFENFPRRTHVRIKMGEPITVNDQENPEALTDRVMRSLASMLPASMRGVYA